MAEFRGVSAWPSRLIASPADVEILELARKLAAVLESLTDRLERTNVTGESDETTLSLAKVELARNALTLLPPPFLLFGRITIIRVRPYWRERLLVSERIQKELPRLLDEQAGQDLSDALRLDASIRMLDTNTA